MRGKRGFYVLAFVFLALFFIRGGDATVGVAPAIYRINYEPGAEHEFYFNFYTENTNARLKVYADGDLAEYLKISTEYLTGGGRVDTVLKLPRKVDTPGIHKIAVGARETPQEGAQGIGIYADVRGLIVVDVPYPGKYAEVLFSTKDANIGGEIEASLSITSKGVDTIFPSAYIEIYDQDNKKVDTISLGIKEVKSTETLSIDKRLPTSNYKAGKYKAILYVNYGGEKDIKLESVFRLGELFVGVSSTTETFERDKINPIAVSIESFWNDPIEHIYAEGRILNSNISFKTTSESLQPWEKKSLYGYFDTTSIKENKFKVKITLFYYNKTTEKIVDLRFKRDINYLVIGLIVALVLVICLFIWLYIKFKRLKKGNAKKK